MPKRGQVTIFLIIGIILLAVFAGVFYLVSSLEKGRLETELASPLALRLKPQITTFIESCLRETVTPAMYLLGIQGGIVYPDDPTTILVTENALINYGYLNGVNRLSLEKMEQQLNRYVEENINPCLDDFFVFANEGITVTEKNVLKADVKIGLEDVTVKAKYKLKVALGDDSFQIEDFSNSVPLRVGAVVREARNVIQSHQQNQTRLLAYVPQDENYFLSSFPFDSRTFIYSLSDKSSVTDSAPFTFMFAIKDDAINSAPELTYIPKQVIQKGSSFSYQLTAKDAEEDLLRFSSDSILFPVMPDGVISQTATPVGMYVVKFSVEDVQGLKDEQQVRIVVKDE